MICVAADPAVAILGFSPVLSELIEGDAPTVKTTLGETAPPVFNTEMSAVPAVATWVAVTIATRSAAS